MIDSEQINIDSLTAKFNLLHKSYFEEMLSEYKSGPNTQSIATEIGDESLGLILCRAHSSIEDYQRYNNARYYASALDSLVQMITKQHDFLALDYDQTKFMSEHPLYKDAKQFALQVEDFKSYFEAYYEFLQHLASNLEHPESILNSCKNLMDDYNFAITPGRTLKYEGLPKDFVQGFEQSSLLMIEDYLNIARVNIGAIHNQGIDDNEIRSVIYSALEITKDYLSLGSYFQKLQLTAHTSIACYHKGEKPPANRYN